MTTIVNDIIENCVKNKPIQYIIDDDKYDRLSLFEELLKCIELYKNYNTFKIEKFYTLFEFIIDNFILNYQTDIIYKNNKIIRMLFIQLTQLNKGQNLLIKLNNSKLKDNEIINLYNTETMLELIKIASKYGTLMTFLYWYKKSKKNNFKLNEFDIQNIINNAVCNSDDRIYKFLLIEIPLINKIFFQRQHAIEKVLQALSISSIPPKYILKRIKLLSTKIFLYPYFNYMISIFNYSKIINELHKYYYITSHTVETLITLHYILIYDYNEEYKNNIMLLLKTKEEQTMLNIILQLSNNYLNNDDFDKILAEKIIVINYKQIIPKINWNIITQESKLCNFILKILTSHNLINKYIENSNYNYYDNYNLKLYYFTRFIKTTDGEKNVIIVNKILHKLRMISKRYIKSKVINFSIKMYNINREIKNFQPNNKIEILKNGSMHHQYQKQKFTNLPPRHLLPGEISNYNNYLIKEKADGILINNLPIGIYPHHDILDKYQVNAEYIEELDLYLVFDIDIPNTTLLERYDIIRNAHEYTYKSSLKEIYNFDEFINIFDSERNIIKDYIKDNKKHLIKWFPKFACLVNNSQLNNELIENIILDTNLSNKIFESEPYNCDGLILSPLDGSREIKIKPQKLMSIDIIFKNDKWFDRDNMNLTNIVIKSTVPKNGKIYRCYPLLSDNELLFTVDSYRYDKNKPNTCYVINNICNIIKYNWSLDISTNKNKELYYYDAPKKIISHSLISMFKYHSNILFEQISKLNPNTNKKWLDLGCGSSKLIHHINKYNPDKYLGLDIDTHYLVKGLYNHGETQDRFIFSPCNLGNTWSETKGQWYSFYNYNIKYDYVVANFSLMHFFTDLFWKQLDNIVSIGTKFIFNIVSQPQDISEWSELNSFLKIENDKVVYKFEWIHDIIKTEPFISDDKIMEQLKKSNWKIINKYNPDSKHKLSNFYTWWTIEKI